MAGFHRYDSRAEAQLQHTPTLQALHVMPNLPFSGLSSVCIVFRGRVPPNSVILPAHSTVLHTPCSDAVPHCTRVQVKCSALARVLRWCR